jgi:hypothetical protein
MGMISPGPKEVFETKYAVRRSARNVLLSILCQRTSVPKQFSHANMKTVYFDDIVSNSYFDSRDGNLFKKKYRFREYIDPGEGAFYSIEVKLKSNKTSSKIKKLIYKRLPEDYQFTTFRHLIDTFENMLNSSLSFIRLASSHTELFPDTIVYYERFRFEDIREDVRYNLDTNITVLPCLKPQVQASNGIRLEHDIFELKGNRPGIFPVFLRKIHLEPISFSKFVWGKRTYADLS